MELKGVLTMTMFAGVILLSFLASTVVCRPSNQDIRPSSSSRTSSSNYLLGQHNQQHYDEHHRNPHRLPSSHHHHHHNNHPHHHSKHGRGHGHNEKLDEEAQHHLQHDQVFRGNVDAGAVSPDVDESNKISPLHTAPSRRSQRYSQRQVLPATSSSASSSTTSARGRTSSKRNFRAPRRLEDEEEYDYDNEEEEEEEEDEEDDGGAGDRHAYLMTTDKKSSAEKMTEDEALSQAFEKHMRPSSSIGNGTSNEEFHDVYAYQLPSDLWFIVRYNKNADGQVEKYMNIVDSFTNYLDKLDKDVKTVSVNVKGVETVFRLTTKHNNSSSSNS